MKKFFLFGPLLFIFIMQNQSAFSHAVLLGSSPVSESSLEESPQEIIFNFNEVVGPIFIKVLDKNGNEVGDLGDWQVNGNDVTVPLKGKLTDGTYIATYRVISADTHPVGGSIVFGVGEPIDTMANMSAGEDTRSGWQLPVALNRFIQYFTMLLAVGSALFYAAISNSPKIRDPLFKLGYTSSCIAIMTYVLAIGFGGSEMVMGGPMSLFSLSTWAQAWGTTLGPSAIIGIPGLAILIYCFRRDSEKTSIPLFLLGCALSIGSFLVTGHAATASPVWLMSSVVALHLLSSAFWLGGLYPLLISLKVLDGRESAKLMINFSNKALWFVGLLFLSGIVISWVQVVAPKNLMNTDYGLRLIAKIVIFVIILTLAAINKFFLTPALEKEDNRIDGFFAMSIRFEYIAMVLVIAVATSLTLVSPPRAISFAGGNSSDMGMQQGFKSSVNNEKYQVDISLDPGLASTSNMLMLEFSDGSGNPVEMQKVAVFWSLPSAGLEGISGEGELVVPGMFHFMFDQLIIPGEWSARVEASVDDFDKQIFRFNLSIR